MSINLTLTQMPTACIRHEYDAPPTLTPLPAGSIGPNAASIPLPLSGLPGFEDFGNTAGV